MSEFEGKVVLVTGAGTETGRSIAQAFAALGAIVAANDMSPINLDQTIASITAGGGTARDYVGDTAGRLPMQVMVDQVVSDWGRIDVLVNNLAIFPRGSILELDDWGWRRAIDSNLGGAFYTMQAPGRVMRTRNGGVMLNVCDTGGLGERVSRNPALAASASGLAGLTQAAGNDLAEYNIRVNAVYRGRIGLGPGIRTVTNETIVADSLDVGTGDSARDLSELIRLVLFLASTAGENINGQVIHLPE